MTTDINNTFNVCAHLVENDTEVKKFLEENKNTSTLKLVFVKQLMLQKYLEETKEDWYMPSFDRNVEKTDSQTLQLIRFCKLHFDREYFELEDSLGGMSRGLKEASSIAKPWKSKHMELQNFVFNDLSEDDKTEIRMEYIDMLHFIAMYGLALGMDEEKFDHDLDNDFELYSKFRNGVEGDIIDTIDIIHKVYRELNIYHYNPFITCGEIMNILQHDTKPYIDSMHIDIENMIRCLYRNNVDTTTNKYSDLLMAFLSFGIVLGLSSDDIKYLYTRKNLENFDRQERGY